MTAPTATLLPLSAAPLYARLKEVLRARILDGTYAPYGQMPSEHELCAMFEVSRITVRQALGDLQKEGLLFKIHVERSLSPRRPFAVPHRSYR